MSCLTKISLFFLVLSIVCNSTLSDITEECIANASEVFLPYNDKDGVFIKFMPPWFYFKLAMFLLSQSVIDSKSPKNIVNHLQTHRSAFEQYYTTKIPIFDEENNDTLWLLCLSDKAIKIILNTTSAVSEKKYIIGYFRSLVSKLYNVAEFINGIANSPKQFCEKYQDYEYLLCANALYIMLSLKSFNSKTVIDDMKGYNAFIYCYLNYTYNDFTINKILKKLGSSDGSQSKGKNVSESSSSSGSRMNQDESINQFQIGVMNDYYNHMLHVSTQIAITNETNRLKLFPTVEEYCNEELVNSSK